MNRKVLGVAFAIFAVLVGGAYALLTQYASATGTASVQQSVISADNGTTLNAVWNGDNTSTTINAGETANIFFDVNNRNREKAINVSVSGTFTTPDGDGNDITSVNLNGVACTYTPSTLTFTCANQEQASATAGDWYVQFVTADAAPAGTYNATVTVAPAA